MYINMLREVLGDNRVFVENPAWLQCEAAILRLNGSTATEVSMAVGGDIPYMGVAGGGETGYMVFVVLEDSECRSLVDPTRSRNRVSLVAGGQESSPEERECVDLKTALRAAKVYAELGVLEESLFWEETSPDE